VPVSIPAVRSDVSSRSSGSSPSRSIKVELIVPPPGIAFNIPVAYDDESGDHSDDAEDGVNIDVNAVLLPTNMISDGVRRPPKPRGPMPPPKSLAEEPPSGDRPSEKKATCRYFLFGECRVRKCRFLHERDSCKYWFLNGTCARGDSCLYVHDQTRSEMYVGEPENLARESEISSTRSLEEIWAADEPAPAAPVVTTPPAPAADAPLQPLEQVSRRGRIFARVTSGIVTVPRATSDVDDGIQTEVARAGGAICTRVACHDIARKGGGVCVCT
jgi:hypothetical protein